VRPPNHAHRRELDAIRTAVAVLDYRGAAPAIERIELWQDVKAVQDELAVIARDIQGDATEALIELLRESGEPALETALGVVHVGYTQPTERWEGHRLIGALSRTVFEVDPETGELSERPTRAVPVDVLRDTVAGCASEDLTSSKWRKTGVRNYVDPRRYMDRDDPIPIIRTGAPR
jgi:hypothetical protein